MLLEIRDLETKFYTVDGIVNAVNGTILRILTLPFNLITLGIISRFITAILLSITDALTDHLTIDDFFWTTIWAAIILAIAAVAVEFCLQLIFWREPVVAFIDRVYDAQLPIRATGISLDLVFPEEMLAGGYRKKYLRAISRLVASTLA